MFITDAESIAPAIVGWSGFVRLKRHWGISSTRLEILRAGGTGWGTAGLLGAGQAFAQPNCGFNVGANMGHG